MVKNISRSNFVKDIVEGRVKSKYKALAQRR